MKIASSLIRNAYPKTFEKPTPRGAEAESRKPTALPGKRTDAANGFDTVDLKSGLELEKIQQLLTTEIGKKVDKMMTDAGIDLSQAAGLDGSAEATSGRIFDMTTGLFGVWRDQHPDMSEEELIDSFEKVIRSSVDRGYEEASALIAASGFSEQTAEITGRTMSLLHERYDTYFEELRNNLGSQSDSE